MYFQNGLIDMQSNMEFSAEGRGQLYNPVAIGNLEEAFLSSSHSAEPSVHTISAANTASNPSASSFSSTQYVYRYVGRQEVGERFAWPEERFVDSDVGNAKMQLRPLNTSSQYHSNFPAVNINVGEFLNTFEKQYQEIQEENEPNTAKYIGNEVELKREKVENSESKSHECGDEHVSKSSGTQCTQTLGYTCIEEKADVGKTDMSETTTESDEHGEQTAEIKEMTSPTKSDPICDLEESEDQNKNDSFVKEDTQPSTSNSETPRKNKRKMGATLKIEQSSPEKDTALFTMMKSDEGTMINVTEDRLKAMIEESLRKIAKEGNNLSENSEQIVDNTMESVKAAVLSRTVKTENSAASSDINVSNSDSGQAESKQKKRRKKSSPKQLKVDPDTDYNPIMDEDTDIDEEFIPEVQVKKRKSKEKLVNDSDPTPAKTGKKRKTSTKGRKCRKKKKDENVDVDIPGEEVDGEDDIDATTNGEGVEKPKKRPKSKKEKQPREKKSLMCEECGKVFMRADLLRNHKRCHTGDKPFVCSTCGLAFRESGHLKRHMTIHTGKKPYKCDICGKELNSSLAKHKRRHLNDRQFPCTMCEKRFVSGFELKQHMQTHLKREHIPCSICGKTCSNMSILKRHLQTHSDERNFPCNICTQRFKSKQDCQRHMTIHFLSPTCTCHLCGKQFTQDRYLKRHLDRHERQPKEIVIEEVSEERPFQCEFCYKCFATTANLNQHLALHVNQGSYACYICSKMFSQPRYLKRHIKRHLGHVLDMEEEEDMMSEEEREEGEIPLDVTGHMTSQVTSHMVSPHPPTHVELHVPVSLNVTQ